MAATALIKFTQGAHTAAAGVAVEGTLFAVDGSVAVSNGDNTDVVSWVGILLDAPPDSANYPPGSNPQVLGSGATATPAATFDPDAEGQYRILLDVVDATGARDRDIRCFGVRNGDGLLIPPYQKNPDPLPIADSSIVPTLLVPASKPDEQNYGGQVRGWAGTGSSGQMEQFIREAHDLKSATISSTPYDVAASGPPLLLVDTATIGGASVVNLPAGARVGQAWMVLDVSGDAFNSPINVTAPAGETFLVSGSAVAAVKVGNDYTVVRKVTATQWLTAAGRSYLGESQIYAGSYSTSSTSYERICDWSMDLGAFPNVEVMLFQALLETTDLAYSADVRLYNLTTGAVVAGTSLSETSTTPTLSVALLVPGVAMPASGANTYELQIKMGAASSSQRVQCSSAKMLYVVRG